MKRYVSEVLAYLVPTFALGFVWHLVLFQSYYEALAMYRRDIIIPFGFPSMLIQAAIFAWLYEKAFAVRHGGLWTKGNCLRRRRSVALLELHDACGWREQRDGASVPDYLLIETVFTLVQWTLVAPLTVLSGIQPQHTTAASAVQRG